jgi:sec-independent protein translocase protein TatA
MFGRWEEILLIVAIALLLFGAERIPKVAKSLGESIKEFKKGMNSDSDESKEAKDKKKIKG